MANTKEKALINSHFTCQLTRFYTKYKLADVYDKSDIKEKVNDLVRLHKKN